MCLTLGVGHTLTIWVFSTLRLRNIYIGIIHGGE